jgi:hypothetical protein
MSDIFRKHGNSIVLDGELGGELKEISDPRWGGGFSFTLSTSFSLTRSFWGPTDDDDGLDPGAVLVDLPVEVFGDSFEAFKKGFRHNRRVRLVGTIMPKVDGSLVPLMQNYMFMDLED